MSDNQTSILIFLDQNGDEWYFTELDDARRLLKGYQKKIASLIKNLQQAEEFAARLNHFIEQQEPTNEMD